jgi:hypothetical protein
MEEKIETVQKEWMGETEKETDNTDYVVMKECSCLFD